MKFDCNRTFKRAHLWLVYTVVKTSSKQSSGSERMNSGCVPSVADKVGSTSRSTCQTNAADVLPTSSSSYSNISAPGLVTSQLYSVNFSQSRFGVKKCVFSKRTIKVCINCFWWCPGISAPSAAHLMVAFYLCSSGSNARGESRAL